MKWLTSVKTAIMLILLIVLSSIIATILQTDLNIYQTLWYRILLLLFCLNLILCTAQKLPTIINVLNDKPQLENNDNYQTIKLHNSKEISQRVLETLKNKGYHIKSNKNNNVLSIVAQKNRLNLLAPYILHTAIVIVFLGAFISSYGVNKNIYCNIGEVTPLPANILKGASIKVKSSKTIYDQNGNVDNWETTFKLLHQGKMMTSKTIKVNHPLKYNGIKFYQSGYGFAHELQILHGNHLETYSIPNNKLVSLANQVIRIVRDETGYILQEYSQNGVVKTAHLKTGQVIKLPNNQKVNYKGFNQYTVINVKHDPGTPVVFIGMTLMAICSPCFWLGRYRKVKLLINHSANSMVLNVSCKNQDIREATKKVLLQQIRG